jgi:2-isopropylmalate synthase
MITDDTLREGMQAPGLAFSIEEKLNMSRMLAKAGIQRILVSYPSAHISEANITEMIVKENKFKEVFALGRAIKEDIDIINKTGSNISLHLPFKQFDASKIYENIKYACTLGKEVEVSFVDIDMFPIDDIVNFCRKMESIGVNVVQLPDTRGKLSPIEIYKIIGKIKKETKLKIEAHCHNDHGLAVANSIAAINAGVDYIDTTVFGIGERNGIADSLVISDYIKNIGGPDEIKIKEMLNVYNYVYNLIIKKIGIDFFIGNMPVYGVNSEIQTAGTHVASGSVFDGKKYSVNVYTGRNMVREILEVNNIHVNFSTIEILVSKIKDISSSEGRALKTEEIIKLAGELQ